jgi:hypothetical protein
MRYVPEASLKCRSCRKGRYAPPVRMIKLTDSQQITPYKWVHPDEERQNAGIRFLRIPKTRLLMYPTSVDKSA